MKDIVGILVCNTQKVLDHKLKDGKESDGNYCYWDITRFPKRINVLTDDSPNEWFYEEDDSPFYPNSEVRLYFAVGGEVKGYFICKAMNENIMGFCQLRFYSESWTPIAPIRIKNSQGYRYFVHDSPVSVKESEHGKQ